MNSKPLELRFEYTVPLTDLFELESGLSWPSRESAYLPIPGELGIDHAMVEVWRKEVDRHAPLDAVVQWRIHPNLSAESGSTDTIYPRGVCNVSRIPVPEPYKQALWSALGVQPGKEMLVWVVASIKRPLY